MTITRFDIAIFNLQTGVVQSIAEYSVPEDEARRLVAKLNDSNLQNHLLADWFPAGAVCRGDIVEVNEARLDRLYSLTAARPHATNSRFMSTYRRRKAACICVMCEATDLETAIHCPRCAQTNRERVARSAANTL